MNVVDEMDTRPAADLKDPKVRRLMEMQAKQLAGGLAAMNAPPQGQAPAQPAVKGAPPPIAVQGDAPQTGFGAGNAGAMMPGSLPAEAGPAPFTPTLAPQRQLPTVYKSMKDLPGGTFKDTGAGFVRMGQEMGLAGSDNPQHQAAAFESFLDRFGTRLQPSPGGGQGYASQSEIIRQALPMFGQMGAMAKGSFDSDTQRGLAGIQEYGQKVRGPQEDLTKLATQEMQGQAQRDVAEIGRKTASQAGLTSAIQAAQQAGRPMTAQEQRDLIDTYRAIDNDLKGPAPAAPGTAYGAAAQKQLRQAGLLPIQVQGPAPPVGVQAPPAGEARPPAASAPAGSAPAPAAQQAPTLEDIAKRKQATLNTADLVDKALGRTPENKAGKYAADKVVAALAGVDPAMLGDDAVDLLISEARKAGVPLDQLTTDASKEYLKASRATGKFGKYQVKEQQGWDGMIPHNSLTFTDEQGNPVLQGREAVGVFPGWGGVASGTRSLFGTYTGKGTKDEEKRRGAAERLMGRLLKQQGERK